MPEFVFRDIADVEAFERQPIEALGLPSNVYDAIRDSAAVYGNRVATYGLMTGSADEEPQARTFSETFSRITQSANLLHGLGLGTGDAVTLLMPIIPDTAVCLWGAETAGIANPVNPFLEIDYLEGIMRAAGAKVIIAPDPSIDPVAWPKVEELRARIPDLLAVIQVGGNGPISDGVIHFETAIADQPGDRLVFDRTIEGTDIAAYFHTGGTTGLPKLAKHTHFGQVLQNWLAGAAWNDQADEPAGVLGIPMFHVGGAMLGSLCSLQHGRTIAYLHPNGFRDATAVRDALRNAARFKSTLLFGVPAVWSAFLTLPTDGLDLSRVTAGVVGGSTLSVEVADAVMSKFGVPMIEGWGMTETHGFAVINPAAGDIRVGSIGLRLPYTQVRVVALDENGGFARDCGVEESGVLLVRGPGVMAGYVDPAHNDTAWVDCGDGAPWLNTGDLARMDGDQYVWLAGRAKDLIIRGGHNIDPAVVEDVLYAHPDIELAAAVGQPDRRVGEVPVAYVQMKAGRPFDENELKSFVDERVAERAASPKWIAALDEMPLTPVGKIFKPSLRNDAARRIFQAELTSLAEPGETVEVAVESHPSYGAHALITVNADANELRRKCHDAMAGYPMRFEIRDQ